MYTFFSAVTILALVLRTVLLTLHFVSLPHAVDPNTGHLVHLHQHSSEENCKHAHAEARSEPGIHINYHSCGDSGIHNCPYNHFLHQPSNQNLSHVGVIEHLLPSQATDLPNVGLPFIRENLHLLAPMNSPPV